MTGVEVLTIPRTHSDSLLSRPSTAMLVLRTEMARMPELCLLILTSCSLLSSLPYWSYRVINITCVVCREKLMKLNKPTVSVTVTCLYSFREGR